MPAGSWPKDETSSPNLIMERSKAEEIVNRMVTQAESKAPTGVLTMYKDAYIKGNLQAQLIWLLQHGKFDPKKFDKNGNYQPI